VIDRRGQTWRIDGTVYLVFLSEEHTKLGYTVHRTLVLDDEHPVPLRAPPSQAKMFEFEESRWDESDVWERLA
jgi:hypothetical protein